jgi:hypothetical protein
VIIVAGDPYGVDARGGQVDLLVSEARLGFSDGELELLVDQRLEDIPGRCRPRRLEAGRL